MYFSLKKCSVSKMIYKHLLKIFPGSFQPYFSVLNGSCWLHGPSVLADRPISVGALLSIQLLSVLRKYLVIGQFGFSLFSTGHHTGSKLP